MRSALAPRLERQLTIYGPSSLVLATPLLGVHPFLGEGPKEMDAVF